MGWFRAYDGVSTDPKYLVVAQRCGLPVERVVAVWLHVLDCTNQREAAKRGLIDNVDVEAFAAFIQRPVEEIESILVAMRTTKRDGSPGMLDGDRVTAWRKRQPLREDEGAAERKRRQRDRQAVTDEPRDIVGNENVPQRSDVSRNVTLGHALQEETRQDKTDSKSHTPESDDSARKEAAPDGAAAVAAARVRRKPQDEPEGFAAFYAAYPKRVARPGAAKAFGKARRRASEEEIMRGLERAKSEWRRRGTDLDHVPHPATWLNDDRWADEADRLLAQSPRVNGNGPLGHLSSWEQSQLKLRAEEQVRSEGLNPHDGDGMQRVGVVMMEAASAQRHSD